ncbi:hypothetical protein V8U11_06580 [Pseudomonas chlororaphis]|uniref:hypothetical protein n=1 Tax=Pseudomonas chlororaphis TaxID=587753 RepID=UPI0030CD2F9D
MTNKPNPPLLKTSDLPMPRLELRWDTEDAPPPEGYPTGTKACRYLLVVPLGQWDIRREDENCAQVRNSTEIELNSTIRTGGNPQLVWLESNRIDTPYRDHSHACWDSHVLKIPAYATAGNYAMLLDPTEPNLPPFDSLKVAP